MAGTDLKASQYSHSFNSLVIFGAWTMESDNVTKRKLYVLYQFFVLFVTTILNCLFFMDFYDNFGDLKNMSWNVCVATLFAGGVLKLLDLYRNRNLINTLRLRLHLDRETRTLPDEKEIQETNEKQMVTMKKIMYVATVCFCLVWIVTRYLTKFSDNKLLPVPLYLPGNVDLDAGHNYDIVYVSYSFFALSGIAFIIEQEMAMFSILMQFKREYDLILGDIRKLDSVYESECVNGNWEKAVMNPWLQTAKTKVAIKTICIRQQALMGYIETYDFCYNRSMVLQVMVITILAVSIAVQCILLPLDYLPELAYQIGYIFIVLTDMYLLCLMGTKLKTQCRDIGEALYDTVWYKMSPSVRKDLVLMMLISQRPPRISCLKVIEIDLPAYMGIIKNIYSWLALFRQLAV